MLDKSITWGPSEAKDEKGQGVKAELEAEPSIIKIDRSKPFDPSEFVDEGWTIDESDERSRARTEVDLARIQLEHMLRAEEKVITGEEMLRRLKANGHIRLDAKVLQTLWEHQEKIPEKWKEKTNGYPTFVFFDGTILRRANGHRFVLYLFWNGGEWNRGYGWLENYWDAGDPSAVLAS